MIEISLTDEQAAQLETAFPIEARSSRTILGSINRRRHPHPDSGGWYLQCGPVDNEQVEGFRKVIRREAVIRKAPKPRKSVNEPSP